MLPHASNTRCASRHAATEYRDATIEYNTLHANAQQALRANIQHATRGQHDTMCRACTGASHSQTRVSSGVPADERSSHVRCSKRTRHWPSSEMACKRSTDAYSARHLINLRHSFEQLQRYCRARELLLGRLSKPEDAQFHASLLSMAAFCIQVLVRFLCGLLFSFPRRIAALFARLVPVVLLFPFDLCLSFCAFFVFLRKHTVSTAPVLALPHAYNRALLPAACSLQRNPWRRLSITPTLQPLESVMVNNSCTT